MWAEPTVAMPRRVARAGLLAMLVAFSVAGASAQWPQFRGPDGLGTSPAARLPLTWSETQNVRWKTAIHGRAWSSPVILDGQIWLTTATENGRELSVLTLDKESGKILRDVKLFDVATPQYAHPFNTYASPTPAMEPGRIYVTFGSPGTAAIDTRSGKVLWERRDLECNHYRGAGSSPVIFENLLLMHFDGSDQQYVVGLDKDTGKTVWKTPRSVDFQDEGPDGKPQAEGDYRKGFSTPHVITVEGRPVMISIGSKATYAYDPRSGRELWKVIERASHSPSTRPVVGHGLVYVPTGFQSAQLLAIRPDGQGDVTATHVAWRVSKGVPNKPSVVLVGSIIYMVSDAGVLNAVDAKSGEIVGRGRVAGTFSASPLAALGRVYVFSEDGKTIVFEANPQMKVLAENQLDEGFMASPAVDGAALYLRTRTHLYRIEETK